MLDNIIECDYKIISFLNSLGSEKWDFFWLFITTPIYWIPLLFLFLFLGYRFLGLKKATIIGSIIILSTSVTVGIVNIIKNSVKRFRPVNDTIINGELRKIIEAHDFSFLSGHSATSFTIAFMTYWVLKRNYKYSILIFLFPLLFAYSRLYLAAHFLSDIIAGALLGFFIAKLGSLIIKKWVLLNHSTNC